jgi:hypothetical protein
MKLLLSYSSLAAIVIIILSSTSKSPNQSITIRGNIVQASTNQHIENAYLYVVQGEEEALSAKDGSFSIATWKNLPVTLVAEHHGFKQTKVIIKDASQKLLIKLEPK